MGWLDALVGAAGNAARSTANNTVKAASQPSQRQSSPRQQQSTAPSSNFWQALGSAVSRSAQRPQQQQGTPTTGGGWGWDVATQSENRTNGSSSAGGAIKQPQKKTEDEKGIYSSESKQGKSNEDNDIFAKAALGLVAPGAAEALAVGNAISQIMGPEKAYAAEGEEGDFTGSEGGTFGMSPETYREAVRENPELFGNKELSGRNYKDMAEDMGEAASFANPVGTAKGILGALKSAKSEKLLGKATKLEEQANKLKGANGGKKATEAAKAGEEAAEEASGELLSRAEKAAQVAEEKGTKKAAAEARKIARQETNREKMLTNEEGYFGNAAKNATKDYKALTAGDLKVPGLVGAGLLGVAGLAGAIDPSIMERPLGESLASEAGNVLKDTGWDTGPIGASTPNKLEGMGDDERAAELGRLGLADEESYSPLRTQYRDAAANQLYYGHTLNELGQMYENDIINAAINDPEYRKLYEEAGYLEPYGSYVNYADLGDSTDYSSREDITRDIFGLNPERRDLEIKGLQQIYKEQGIINDKMTDEEKLQAILEDKFINNRVDPYEWLSNADYESQHPLLGTTLGNEFADYWIENQYIPQQYIDALSSLGNDVNTMDAKDIAAMINTGNIANQMMAGTRFDPSLFGGESGYLTGAGDKSDWSWLSGDESKDKGLYRPEKGWNANGRDYSAAAIGEALYRAAENPEAESYWNLSAYGPYGIDADMADYLAAMAEQTDKQKRSLGRKETKG